MERQDAACNGCRYLGENRKPDFADIGKSRLRVTLCTYSVLMYTMGVMAYMCPPVRLRRLGLRLRHLGEANGPNLDEAADLMKRARSALGRTENAQVVVRPHEVDHILMKYGVTDERARRTLLTLAAG